MEKLNIVVCLLAIICLPNAVNAVDYTYTEILPPGWTQSDITEINNTGIIAGYGFRNGSWRGFTYI